MACRELQVPITSGIDTGLALPEARLRAVFNYDPETGQLSGVDLNGSCLLYRGDGRPERVPVALIVMLLNGEMLGARQKLHDDTLSYLDALAADDAREEQEDAIRYGRTGT